MQLFKQSLGLKFKNILWGLYNNSDGAICPCCNIVHISKTNYSAGHIIAEAKGGIVAFFNIVPICRLCNNKMGQHNLLKFAEEKFNSQIKTLPQYDKYKQQIENNENLLYNTRQITKTNFIVGFIIKLISYIKNNAIMDEIKNFDVYEHQRIDKEYEEWIYNKLTTNDCIFTDIKIIKKISHSIKYKKYYIDFIIKPLNTYKIQIKSQTDEIYNSNDILTTINAKKLIMKKYPYLDYSILFDTVKINNEEYIIIDNLIYNKKTLTSSTGTPVGEIKNKEICYF